MRKVVFTKTAATITWPDATKTVLKDVKYWQVFQKDSGYYVLDHRGVVYINSNEQKVILKEPDWFNLRDKNSVIYFPRTNVLIVTVSADHDYIWWWNLNSCSQDSKLEKPAWFNGSWNNELEIKKYNDRFAIAEEYTHEIIGEEEEDNEEEEDSDEHKIGEHHYKTLFWDTVTMKIHEYSGRVDTNKLEIRENLCGFEAFLDGKKMELEETVYES